ncbi:MAG: HAD-IIIA family hydrolase [Bacteroidales bacterium]|nr:HAD-IIIA family hydrolase [Bacteroidales bacterium]
MHLKDLSLNNEWTLFLDRDGVINERLAGDYVKTPEEFRFIEGVPEALAKLSKVFGLIIIVTNQQGIGKGLMTEEDLRIIHDIMISGIQEAGGRINKIYHSSHLDREDNAMRKPNTGMAEQAKIDFPEIDFSMSVMVGDSQADMEFGRRMGMINVYIGDISNPKAHIDLVIKSLPDLIPHLNV